MKQLLSAQELARRNNENAAVFAAYERRRKRRRLIAGKKKRISKKLDERDWQAAEREARPVRAVGFFLPRA